MVQFPPKFYDKQDDVDFDIVNFPFLDGDAPPALPPPPPRRTSYGVYISLRKTLTSGLGLDDMSLTWLAVVQLLVFVYSGIK